jgi:hypothetical protein
MISEYEVISQLHHPLHIVWITLLQKKKQLSLYSCLVVVLFLILNKLDSHKLFVLVVHTFDYLTECSLSDNLNQLVSVSYVIIHLDSVISFFIVESIVNQSFKLGWLNLFIVFAEIVNLFIFFGF